MASDNTPEGVAWFNPGGSPGQAGMRNGPHVITAPPPADGLDLTRLLWDEVFPRLTVEAVFTHEAHHLTRSGDELRGGCPWHGSDKSHTAFSVNPATLQWYCFGCKAGGGPVEYLHRLHGGSGVSPKGEDFVSAARRLFELAGVPFPGRRLTPAQAAAAQRIAARQAVLASVYAACGGWLVAKHGDGPRAWLAERGFREEEWLGLGVGFYLGASQLRGWLVRNGHDAADVEASGAVWDRMDGYVVFPWLDDRGAPLTLYGKWPGKEPPPGKKKTLALPNPKGPDGSADERTKRSPLYLDRALRAGCRDLVLVEGTTDAAMAQVRGDPRAVACVAGLLSRDQVETLRRRGAESVTVALDPDKAGRENIAHNVRRLWEAGVRPYVAPELPDGLDPDDFIARDGIDAWKAHVGRRSHGFRRTAEDLIAAQGGREPGDDFWADDLASKAAAVAAELGERAGPELRQYFWPPIAEAVGGSVEDLMARTHEASPAKGGPPPPAVVTAAPAVESLRLIDSATFAATDYTLRWHVKKVLVRGQPALIAGPKKCLKTSILCDLAVSIGTGKPFLGVFPSEGPTRVGFFSGESGPHAIKSTALLVCAARGVRLEDANVWWSFAVPQLSRAEHLAMLASEIRRHQLEGVVIDPLYLSLLSGNPDVKASNLYDMGPLLATVTGVCLQAGADPFLCHHFIKRPADPFGIPELEDMAGAGVAEFARQWVLVGRRERYEPGTGLHKLWLNVGGSAGFSSCWSVDVDEGVLADDFSGRKWEAFVEGAASAISGKKDQAEKKREEKQSARRKEDDAKVLIAIDQLTAEGQPYSATRVRDKSGLNSDKFRQAVERLAGDGLIERCEVKVPTAKGAMKPAQNAGELRHFSRQPVANSQHAPGPSPIATLFATSCRDSGRAAL